MAQIPLQVAQRTLDTGGVVQYPGGGEIGRAMQSAGSELTQLADYAQQKQDQMDRFKRIAIENEFDQSVANQSEELARNAPADGSGIHDGIVGQIDPKTGAVVKPGLFDNLAQQFRDRVPASQRGYFDASLNAKRLSVSGSAASTQYAQEQKFATLETSKIQDGLLNSILQTDPGDTASYDAYKEKGRAVIEASPLSALAKQAALDAWDQQAPKALAQAITARDPGKLRAMLGMAPSSANLPAGMRNNNPGNIKFVSRDQAPGVIGPSANTDQGDPQAVFSSPEAGMRAAYELALKKYAGGKVTANQLIAGQGGWTPGNTQAAANIAATMGIRPDDNLNLRDPASAQRFLRALVTQEHGQASRAYSDQMIADAVAGKPVPNAAPKHTGPDLPIVFGNTAGRVSATPDMSGINPDMMARFRNLQNTFGASLPIVSGFRDPARNERAGGAKASQHLHGNAFDIDVSGMSQDERARLIQTARSQGFGGIGVYANSIHIDVGPVRAWGASHHSDSLPAWAQTALAGAPGSTAAASAPPADPRFASLSPDDRISLANADDVAFSQKESAFRAQANASYSSYKDAMELSIVQGKVRDEGMISNDNILKDGDKATLIRSLRSQNETLNQTQADLSALAKGGLLVDPYDSKGRTRVDNVFAESMKHVPQDQRGAVATEIIRQTGVVPQPVVNTMRQGLTSQDPAQVAAAAQTAQRISQLDPAALGRRDGGGEVQKAADDFTHMVNDLNMSPTDAAKRLMDLRDPKKQQTRKALEPAAKEFVKSLNDVDLAKQFKTGWLGGAPSLGITPEQEFGIKADFNAIAEDMFYAKNGDAELAKNAALEQMKALYGVSDLAGGHVLMKHPPERYWPRQSSENATTAFGLLSIPGTAPNPWQYVQTQLYQDVSSLDEDFQPGSIQLVTTPETDAAVKRGEMPGYAVLYKDKNGVQQTIPGKLWRPDVTHMLQTEKANADKRQSDANDRAQQKDIQINSGRDREFGMDNMLGGNTQVYTPERQRQFLNDQAKTSKKREPGSNIPADIPAPDEPQTSFGNAM